MNDELGSRVPSERIDGLPDLDHERARLLFAHEDVKTGGERLDQLLDLGARELRPLEIQLLAESAYRRAGHRRPDVGGQCVHEHVEYMVLRLGREHGRE